MSGEPGMPSPPAGGVDRHEGGGERGSTIRRVLQEASRELAQAGVEYARMDAEVLVQRALGRDRAFLTAYPDSPVEPGQVEWIAASVRRRVRQEPLQYITGFRDFWKDTFAVGPAVLIPRPETEILVEEGARLLKGRPGARVLDLATGSGCVGLSLVREVAGVTAVGTDVSGRAAAVARTNARRLGLWGRFRVVVGDGLGMWRVTAAPGFDLIVSNPPYVPEVEWPNLPAEVREWEPRRALVGGTDGLDFYRRWVPAALRLVKPGGGLVMEFGAGQWAALQQILAQHDASFDMRTDLAGIPRAFVLRRPH